ncbi:hypothetical protein [Puniceicoccus vermicola]|uniref:Uncharacterized protein n=1 Tax=Puniceicoccus vermicola TaxID=388746 RepID=A0A7X1B4N3_9BACT|nr:hypothetical protein [Puniceicoccus vermicola]MBC2604320.1 hypothetical protein [Puniceicoccus vermicola]
MYPKSLQVKSPISASLGFERRFADRGSSAQRECSKVRHQRDGFALIISLGLMAFTVLLLVLISSSIAVEGQGLNQESKVILARQDAFLGMTIATGQLQKFAGPDQRVTTTADLVATMEVDGDATPDPLYSTTPRIDVSDGARYWTAVWGNDHRDIGYDIAPDEMPRLNGNVRGMSPVLLNWLVSGNGNAGFSFDGRKGGVNSGNNPSFTPGDGINLADPGNPSVNGRPAVTLVGPASVDATVANPESYVVAPLEEIVSASTGNINGRFAWWVGDEGVKARVNLQNGYQKTGVFDDEIYSFLVSQRSGVEFIEGQTPGRMLLNIYDFENGGITRIDELNQLPFAATSAGDAAELQAVSNVRFHDLTASSFGVLSDSYAGGLKKDLTADVADESSDFEYRPRDDEPIFTPVSTSEENLPTWGHFRSWARTHPGVDGQLLPSVPSDEDAGIAPVLTFATLGLDVRVVDEILEVDIFPIATLFNPYPYPIKATDYEVGFRFTEDSLFEVRTAKEDSSADPEDLIQGFATDAVIDWGKFEVRSGDERGTESNFIYFSIDGMEIPPGEAHIYYLDPSHNEAVYSEGMTLTRSPAGQDATPLYYCKMPGAVAMDPTDDFYIQVVGGDAKWGNSYRLGVPKADVVLALAGGIENGRDFLQHAETIKAAPYAEHPGDQFVVHLGEGDTYIDYDDKGKPVEKKEQLDPGHVKHKYGERIEYGNAWEGLTTGPRSAFRYGSAGEQRGGRYSSCYVVGLPFVSRVWMRHGNHRAPTGALTNVEINTTNYNAVLAGGNISYGFVIANRVDGSYGDVNLYPASNEYAMSMTSSPDGHKPKARKGIYFDILKDSLRLLSLGQLQHVPFSRYTFYTTYPFGNSYAEYRTPRTTNYLKDAVPRPGKSSDDTLYDLSYHLNRAMWDRYFFSTVPENFSQVELERRDPFPNSRMVPYQSASSSGLDVEDIRFTGASKGAYDKAASNLLNAGSFNINSTSEQAWRAVLSGTYGVPTNSDYAETEDNVGQIIPFPRISSSLNVQSEGDSPYLSYDETMILNTNINSVFGNQMYLGNRGLYLQDVNNTTNDRVENLVEELARQVVDEVRQRGPFLSLSDFVNRSMTGSDHVLGIKGALQEAIDSMEFSQANPYQAWRDVAGSVLDDRANTYNGNPAYDYDLEQYLGGSLDVISGSPEKSSFRFQFAGSPKYLTQADILSTIGPSLSARTDTFRIRAYGASTNSMEGELDAEAWCELVLQRVPKFVSDSDAPETALDDANLSFVSRVFGRRFQVVSFRWLNRSEI